jgi:hypothetical protein
MKGLAFEKDKRRARGQCVNDVIISDDSESTVRILMLISKAGSPRGAWDDAWPAPAIPNHALRWDQGPIAMYFDYT